MSGMRAVELLFALGWAAFWAYWLVSAFTAKRSRISWTNELLIRGAIVVCAIVLLRLGVLREGDLTTDPVRAACGILLFVLGLGLAVWARMSIGSNWGGPMSRKDDPELVTGGPDRLVRHPIYAGILGAGVGTAIALNWAWLVAVALFGAYFVFSALVEEAT
jgi:protein-S-isoprenylcysteine O-methyltransferase Ste14